MCLPLNMSGPGMTGDSVTDCDNSGHICVYFDSLTRVSGKAEPLYQPVVLMN